MTNGDATAEAEADDRDTETGWVDAALLSRRDAILASLGVGGLSLMGSRTASASHRHPQTQWNRHQSGQGEYTLFNLAGLNMAVMPHEQDLEDFEGSGLRIEAEEGLNKLTVNFDEADLDRRYLSWNNDEKALDFTGAAEWSNEVKDFSGSGSPNAASGTASVAAGGEDNDASGDYSTIPGGQGNVASGNHSFAAGHGATAEHKRSFVWAAGDAQSSGPDTVLFQAPNGASIAEGDLDIEDGDLGAEGSVTARTGDVTADNGNVQADSNVTARNGDVTADSGSVTAEDAVTARTGDVTADDGHVTAENDVSSRTGDVTADSGSVTASENVTAQNGDVTAESGDLEAENNVTARTGDLRANSNVTAQNGNITAENGDILADTGSVSAQENVTARDGYVSAGSSVIADDGVRANTGHVIAKTGDIEGDDLIARSTVDTATVTSDADLEFAVSDTDEVISRTDLTVEGDLHVTGTKHFVTAVETPAGPQQVAYTAVEAGQPRTEVSDVAELTDGRAVIELPEHFAMVTSEDEPLAVQVTPYADDAVQPQVVERGLDRIVVEDMSDGPDAYTVAYTVKGVREGYEDTPTVREP